jgi:hypothetical protein
MCTLSDGTHIPNVINNEHYQKLIDKKKKIQRKMTWLVEHSPKSYAIEDKAKKWKAADSKQMRRLKERQVKIEKKLNTLIAYEIINQYKLKDHCLLKINKNILCNKIFPNIKLINPPISYDNFIHLLTKYCSTNTSTKSYKNKKSTNVINM